MTLDKQERIDKLNEIVETDEVKEEIERSLSPLDEKTMKSLLDQRVMKFEPGKIYSGHVVKVEEQYVVVDIGYKSEGFINRQEFSSVEDLDAGDVVEVLLDDFDEDSGAMILSKRKADRIRGWEIVTSKYGLGDIVSGKIVRKIKGGLLVDIGVQVFLPASQVDIRRIPEIGDFVGREIEAKIIKIDPNRRNIVLSRRQMLEEQRDKMKEKLLGELEEGEIRTGEVKNITDFGAFVDLGGIDALLHIVDMSWQRVNHPSEIVKIGDKIDVYILKIDQERERISASLKHKTPSPWENIEERYPIGSMHSGKVVNIMPYGAFVQLEDGIEGLVHVSEMSWTKQVNHPSEIVSLNDKVDVVILGINDEKKEISLGMKQTDRNPWESLHERYPEGSVVEGTVKNIVNYGAFVEIEEGIEGLLHVSDMSWTKKINNPGSVVKKGDKVETVVTSIDPERKRVSLSIKHLTENPWDTKVPFKYSEAMVVKGVITNITDKGVFVDIGEVEAFMPHSEVSNSRVPAEELLDPGDEVEVKILTIDTENRSIRLSLREVTSQEEERERLEMKKELRQKQKEEKAEKSEEKAKEQKEEKPEKEEPEAEAEAEEKVEEPEAEAGEEKAEEQAEQKPEKKEPEAEAKTEEKADERVEEKPEKEEAKAEAEAEEKVEEPEAEAGEEKAEEQAEQKPEKKEPEAEAKTEEKAEEQAEEKPEKEEPKVEEKAEEPKVEEKAEEPKAEDKSEEPEAEAKEEKAKEQVEEKPEKEEAKAEEKAEEPKAEEKAEESEAEAKEKSDKD
ncbi:MAG: 30S ribosomal protein S1 [Planctomycetota bacterium]|nr:30S ribosomal protein S1 [Planctomycetota bacterium]